MTAREAGPGDRGGLEGTGAEEEEAIAAGGNIYRGILISLHCSSASGNVIGTVIIKSTDDNQGTFVFSVFSFGGREKRRI